jgi:hypothetical protein
MAKKATTKASGSRGKKVATRAKSSDSGRRSRSQSQGEGVQSDMVDALIKLLQSPLVIDLLAVGATAALAAITEQRSRRAQGAMDTRGSKKVLKAAGKAAAAAVGRRIATEFDEIKAASKRGREDRKATAGAKA